MSINQSVGVYPRELDQSFVVPNGASQVGAIVINSSRGESGTFTKIFDNRQFVETFGEPLTTNPSMYAALAFLEKGNNLLVARVINDAVAATYSVLSTVTPVITLTALGEGAWGNDLSVKISATVNDRFTITVYYKTVQVEEFTVSRTETAKDGFGKSVYVEDVLAGSAYIRATDLAPAGDPDEVSVAASLTAGSDDTVAPTDGTVKTQYDALLNKAEFDVRYLINGGWASSAVAAGLVVIAETRKDCIAILDSDSADSTSADIITYRSTTLNTDSSYAAMYAPWVEVYDSYNDKTLMTPPSGFAAAAYAYTQTNFEPWSAPAGSRRGRLSSATGVQTIFTEGDRDDLYKSQINPIQSFVGRGIQIYGQKTMQVDPSALDRVNVRMLMIQIETDIEKALNAFLFEFNDEFTRNNIQSIVTSYLEDVRVRRGVYAYKAVCDVSNNTSAVIDSNRLILDVYVKPERAAEFIQLNAVITESGASFASSV